MSQEDATGIVNVHVHLAYRKVNDRILIYIILIRVLQHYLKRFKDY